jgi:adenylosuccinate synthase
MSTCVVGLQWGDEAKGKVVDLLAERHDAVVRFNGGPNAGHTVVVGDQKYALSQLPSGVVNPGLACVIGNGVVVDPAIVLREIDMLAARGTAVAGRLWLSDRAHLVMPYHREEDRLREEAAGAAAIGTTRRGVGPCYADKIGRSGSVRVGELFDVPALTAKLEAALPMKNRILAALGREGAPYAAADLVAELAPLAERLKPYVTDTFWYLQRALGAGKKLLFEAAQGSLLDVDHGSYPYVTSSNSSACGVAAGCGVPGKRLGETLGVMKAYTTRVGAGPFPTELANATGDHIRAEGNEFGTVTGRPRRCGWLDLVACRYTAALNGLDAAAVMCMDVLGKLPEVQACVAYDTPEGRTNEFPASLAALARCTPVFRSFPGWQADLRQCKTPADLPKAARAYLDFIAETLGVPIKLCSVGPARSSTIMMA